MLIYICMGRNFDYNEKTYKRYLRKNLQKIFTKKLIVKCLYIKYYLGVVFIIENKKEWFYIN
ncbi:hypothetical protein BGU65_02960 [Clostridioides difficile]|nr:hypothetical protein BGT95_01655 [Clostridioides difficile]PBI22364.1 hypothetical protein BGU56_13480 [Clostridioides difficile]PBI38542.1 hypothetical protein BGU65_02960 [Clostridioides difficile]